MPEHTSVPVWVWAVFAAFVVAMLVLDLLVLHRRAHEVALREAAIWTAVWVTIGLGFGGLLWLWQGGGTAEAYLAGYLIEKSLSLDNIFVFAVIFAAFAIPARYQHRVLMLGIVGALVMRAVFIVAGIRLLAAFHPVSYIFGAILLAAAVKMLRHEPARSRSATWRSGRCAGCCPAPSGCMASGSWSATAAGCWPPRCCWR